MNGTLLLSLRYIQFNKGKTLILVTCLSVLMLLPLSINILVGHYNQVLLERSESTPAVIGARGNRYDLILKSLYYYTNYKESIHQGDIDFINDSDYGTPVPLHLKFTATKFYEDGKNVTSVAKLPVIGTGLSYFEYRDLHIGRGTTLLLLGDAVVGYTVAEILGIKVGDFVLTTPKSAYDQSQSFQLKMPVVGILKKSGTLDDKAIFTDLKTTWVMEGIGHGHDNIMNLEDTTLVNRVLTTDSNIVTTAKIMQYQEVTDENRYGFHFHGAPSDFPLTSMVFLPKNKKSRIIAAAYYDTHPTRMLLAPTDVINELMGFVFKIKQFINANYSAIYFTVFLLTCLIFSLSLKLRTRELETIFKIGSSRQTAMMIILTEIGFILITSAAVAVLGTVIILVSAPYIIGSLF